MKFPKFPSFLSTTKHEPPNLQGATVLVTGASRGIGQAIAETFCAHGARVVGVARSEDKLQKLAEQLGKERFVALPADLSNPQAAARLVRKLAKDQTITAAVLNAGYSSEGSFIKSTQNARGREIALNYLSPAAMLQELLKVFLRQGAGKLFAISSLTALMPFPKNASYAASKAAFYHLLRSVRIEHSQSPIEFSAVLPGLTRTEMSQHFKTPLPQADPQEVADVLLGCWKLPAFPATVGRLDAVARLFNQLSPQAVDKLLTLGGPLLPTAAPQPTASEPRDKPQSRRPKRNQGPAKGTP